MKMMNGWVLVDTETMKQSLGNGLKVTDTRGKKDIIKGNVVSGYQEGVVYFPFYAADHITLQGVAYHVIHEKDIIMVE